MISFPKLFSRKLFLATSLGEKLNNTLHYMFGIKPNKSLFKKILNFRNVGDWLYNDIEKVKLKLGIADILTVGIFILPNVIVAPIGYLFRYLADFNEKFHKNFLSFIADLLLVPVFLPVVAVFMITSVARVLTGLTLTLIAAPIVGLVHLASLCFSYRDKQILQPLPQNADESQSYTAINKAFEDLNSDIKATHATCIKKHKYEVTQDDSGQQIAISRKPLKNAPFFVSIDITSERDDIFNRINTYERLGLLKLDNKVRTIEAVANIPKSLIPYDINGVILGFMDEKYSDKEAPGDKQISKAK